MIQEQKLQELLARVSRHSPSYRELFGRHGIDPSAIRSVADLARLPTTSKEDLQERSDDFLCVPRDRIIEYASTSGTLGSPVTIALTENDLDRLAENEYHSFACADGSATDTYQIDADAGLGSSWPGSRIIQACASWAPASSDWGPAYLPSVGDHPAAQAYGHRSRAFLPAETDPICSGTPDRSERFVGAQGDLYRGKYPQHRFFLECVGEKDKGRMGSAAVFDLCLHGNANGVYRMRARARRPSATRVADRGITGRAGPAGEIHG